MKSEQSNDPKIVWTAEVIESIANRATQLTQKLLGFARKGKHQNTPVELNGAIAETVAILLRTIEKNVVISRILRPLEMSLSVIHCKFSRFCLDLALNARDAMRPETGGTSGGTLTIATRDVFDPKELPQDLPNGNYTEVSVTDTGCGIEPSIIDRIFEPFFTTKHSDRGSGMGLAMVYGIIKNHGGSVQVESTLGKGTVFRAYLPISDDLASAVEFIPPRPIGAQPIRGKGSILLVDDHQIIRDVTAKLLSALGYSVTTASDGSEALAHYKKHWNNVDLVIMDMVMPGMSAHECFTLLRAINPTIKAILSTGYANNNLVQIWTRECLDLSKNLISLIAWPRWWQMYCVRRAMKRNKRRMLKPTIPGRALTRSHCLCRPRRHSHNLCLSLYYKAASADCGRSGCNFNG